MRLLLGLLTLILTACAMAPQPKAEAHPGQYLPYVVGYVQGEPVAAWQVGPPSSYADCQTRLADGVAQIAAKATPDGSVGGACFQLPAVTVRGTAQRPNRPTDDSVEL